MGLGDLFKASKNKALMKEVEELKALLTPEQAEYVDIQNKIKAANEELENTIKESDKEIKKKNSEIQSLEHTISKLEKKKEQYNIQLANLYQEVVETSETKLLQSMGLFEPVFDYATSDEYKEEIKGVRNEAKEIVKNTVIQNVNRSNWTVNGKKSEGEKMVKDVTKLILRAFGTECDELINKVKHSNFESYSDRMRKSFATINKLGAFCSASIGEDYLNNRLKELTLAHEYALKKEQEKEEQRALRERQREEAKLQKEIEEQRKKLEKEQKHYNNALETIKQRIESTNSEEEKKELWEKQQELLNKIADTEAAIKDVDYREANNRAGYVYVISNIGSFGENVYKIGMTRRLDPMERVYELGDASVPYNFDVHAMIFCDDAPALEAALHRAFEAKKVNMINQRREFFKVTLDEIKAVIKKNYDKTVEFVDIPEAEQYRLSEKMRSDNNE